MNSIDKRNYKEDHFQFQLVDNPRTGKKDPKLLTPSMVVHIADKDELKLQLEHYKKPFITDLVPDSTIARRNLVEHVRPALRYWCAKFGMEVPDWLKDEKQYTEMSHEEKVKMFGTDHLVIKEFKKFKQVPLEKNDEQDAK